MWQVRKVNFCDSFACGESLFSSFVELCAKGGVSSMERSAQKRTDRRLEIVLEVGAFQFIVSSHTGMYTTSVFWLSEFLFLYYTKP